MTEETEHGLLIELDKDEVLCLEGDENHDLYILSEGKLMVCLRKMSEVTPVAYLNPGEYLGELSYFDKQPRSADVIALEPSVLIKIPISEKKKQFPDWLITIAKSMTHRLRVADDVIRSKGIKRQNVEAIKPLSIDDQGHYFRIIKEVIKERKNRD